MPNNDKPALTMLDKKTKVEKIPEQNLEISPEDFAKLISKHIKQKSYFVAYLDYEVLIGHFDYNVPQRFLSYKNETITPKYIQKIRIFNQNEELFFWRTGDKIKGRLRKDGEGKEQTVVDAKQVLFGTQITEAKYEDYVVLVEQRGTEIILPEYDLKGEKRNWQVDESQKRIAIYTRNYVGKNEVGQATYVDCRFVNFV